MHFSASKEGAVVLCHVRARDRWRERRTLAIGVLAIPDRPHLDYLRAVVDVVDDAVVTDSHAPEIGRPAQFFAAMGTRCRLQRIELPRDASEDRIGQRFELLARRSHEPELVHGVSWLSAASLASRRA